MSKLIEFLERLGSNSELCHSSGEELRIATARAGLAQSVQAALQSGDSEQLQSLAGAPTNVCCLIHAAEDGDEGAVVPPASLRHAA